MDIMSVALQLKEVGGDAVKKALDKVRESTKGLGAELRKLDDSVGTVGQALAGLATGALVGATLQKIAQETSAAQFAQAQLAAALKSTNNAAGQSVDALNAHAEALAKVTTFGDDAITEAQSLLLTFTKIQGDVFPKATEAVANVAQAMGTDLRGAAIQVGKALNDPILGVTALQRAGIQFTQSQRDQIKVLVESGRQVEAQRIILKELETQFGGSAQAARNTLGGALQGLANDFGNLFEVTQKDSQPAIAAISALSKVLQDLAPVMSGLIVRSIPQLIGAVGGLGAAFVTYTGIVKAAVMTTALLASAETISGLIALARGVKTVADAAAFLNIALTSGGGAKVLVTIAALTAGYGAYKLISNEVEKAISNTAASMQTTSVAQDQARAFMDRLTPSTLAGASAFGILSDKVFQTAKAFRDIGAGPARAAAVAGAGGASATQQVTEKIVANAAEQARRLAMIRNVTTQAAAPLPPMETLAPGLQRTVQAGLERAREVVNTELADKMKSIQQSMAQGFGQALGQGLAAGFDVALSTKSIGAGMKALTGTMLSSLGGMLVQFGTNALIASKTIQNMFSTLFTPGPQSAIAAAAIIAIGAALQASGRGILSGASSRMSVPVAGTTAGFVTGAPGGGALPGISYMPTTASSMGARVMQQQPVNVTVIGPNDPSAQRAIQELITNANRRGNTFAV